MELRKEGFLHKQAPKGLKSWKKRLFRLDNTALYYSKQQGDPVKGKLPLQEIIKIEDSSISLAKKFPNCGFTIATETRTYTLCAETQVYSFTKEKIFAEHEERESWMSAIRSSKLYFENLPQVNKDLETEIGAKKTEIESLRSALTRETELRKQSEESLLALKAREPSPPAESREAELEAEILSLKGRLSHAGAVSLQENNLRESNDKLLVELLASKENLRQQELELVAIRADLETSRANEHAKTDEARSLQEENSVLQGKLLEKDLRIQQLENASTEDKKPQHSNVDESKDNRIKELEDKILVLEIEKNNEISQIQLDYANVSQMLFDLRQSQNSNELAIPPSPQDAAPIPYQTLQVQFEQLKMKSDEQLTELSESRKEISRLQEELLKRSEALKQIEESNTKLKGKLKNRSATEFSKIPTQQSQLRETHFEEFEGIVNESYERQLNILKAENNDLKLKLAESPKSIKDALLLLEGNLNEEEIEKEDLDRLRTLLENLGGNSKSNEESEEKEKSSIQLELQSALAESKSEYEKLSRTTEELRNTILTVQSSSIADIQNLQASVQNLEGMIVKERDQSTLVLNSFQALIVKFQAKLQQTRSQAEVSLIEKEIELKLLTQKYLEFEVKYSKEKAEWSASQGSTITDTNSADLTSLRQENDMLRTEFRELQKADEKTLASLAAANQSVLETKAKLAVLKKEYLKLRKELEANNRSDSLPPNKQ